MELYAPHTSFYYNNNNIVFSCQSPSSLMKKESINFSRACIKIVYTIFINNIQIRTLQQQNFDNFDISIVCRFHQNCLAVILECLKNQNFYSFWH